MSEGNSIQKHYEAVIAQIDELIDKCASWGEVQRPPKVTVEKAVIPTEKEPPVFLLSAPKVEPAIEARNELPVIQEPVVIPLPAASVTELPAPPVPPPAEQLPAQELPESIPDAETEASPQVLKIPFLVCHPELKQPQAQQLTSSLEPLTSKFTKTPLQLVSKGYLPYSHKHALKQTI